MPSDKIDMESKSETYSARRGRGPEKTLRRLPMTIFPDLAGRDRVEPSFCTGADAG